MMSMIRSRLAAGVAAAAALACTGASLGQVEFSEIAINLPGADNGLEAIELAGPPGLSLAGYSILIIEGDGTVAGVLDKIIPLSGSIGDLGLFILRDAAGDLVPGPCEGVNRLNGDFDPDIENGGNTYVIGFGAIGVPTGTDLDTNQDGVIDDMSVFSGFTATDAVSYQDGDVGGLEYAAEFGGIELGALPPFTPDALQRIRTCDGSGFELWAGGDILGTNPGPYAWDPAEYFGFDTVGIDPTGMGLSIGCRNIRNQPCPADFNCDGFPSGDDFDAYTGAFEAGDSSADFNDDGFTSGDDFDAYTLAFEEGC